MGRVGNLLGMPLQGSYAIAAILTPALLTPSPPLTPGQTHLEFQARLGGFQHLDDQTVYSGLRQHVPGLLILMEMGLSLTNTIGSVIVGVDSLEVLTPFDFFSVGPFLKPD